MMFDTIMIASDMTRKKFVLWFLGSVVGVVILNRVLAMNFGDTYLYVSIFVSVVVVSVFTLLFDLRASYLGASKLLAVIPVVSLVLSDKFIITLGFEVGAVYIIYVLPGIHMLLILFSLVLLRKDKPIITEPKGSV